MPSALRGGVPLRRKQSEARDEGNEEVHLLEAKEASDSEWEAEYNEAVAMMTVARERRAGVNRARQFFGNLSHLKVARPSSTTSSRTSHVLDVGNWAIETTMIARPKRRLSFQFPPSRATSSSRAREHGSTTSTLSDVQGAFASP